jgi:hypothetical protein
LKAETLACLAVKPGGIIIISGRFPDGISPIHEELDHYGKRTRSEIDLMMREGEISDGAAAGALYQHAAVRERATLVCVSDGVNRRQCECLGMKKIRTIEQAIEFALREKGSNAEFGIIEEGGEVVPRLVQG